MKIHHTAARQTARKALIAARLLLGGIVTARSIVWTLNYPSEGRGRVTARLHAISTLSTAGTALLVLFSPTAQTLLFSATLDGDVDTIIR